MTQERMYGLDALRGVAMTLGIFLHGSIAYKKGYHYGNWVFDTQYQSYFFDWFYLWINSFRMQTFFLLAGFFARLLIGKIGLVEFFRNRLKRIGLPLVLSYFTILPLTLAPYLLAVEFTTGNAGQQLYEFYFRFFTFRAHFGFMHLWFLQHLLLYYGILVLAVYLTRRSGPIWTRRFSVHCTKVKPFLFLLLTSIALGCLSQFFSTALPSIWTGFIIPLPQVLYYFFFFALGWILENKRELFNSFSSFYKQFLLAGTIISLNTLSLLNNSDMLQASISWRVGLKFLFALQTMLLMIGFFGLFNGVFNKPRPFWKYIADSAYWVYLIHMPIVLTIQLVLVNSPIHGYLRFYLVIAVAIFLSFGSYQLLIRYSWIGTLLNGKRSRT
ncbi:MAG: acyltransferase family protein [Cyclobacteriaceae bacterium]|nr:acyltransferase family protein [Cyclobacteriaceae bacterium]